MVRLHHSRRAPARPEVAKSSSAVAQKPCIPAGRTSPALHAGNRLPLEPCQRASSSCCLAATSVTRLKAPEMFRRNQNAEAELAAEGSLHPISCCAVQWRLRRRRRLGRPAWLATGIGGDDGTSLELARSAKWVKTATEARHATTALLSAGKVNVCLRSAAGDAFFPRQLGACQSSPPVPVAVTGAGY